MQCAADLIKAMRSSTINRYSNKAILGISLVDDNISPFTCYCTHMFTSMWGLPTHLLRDPCIKAWLTLTFPNPSIIFPQYHSGCRVFIDGSQTHLENTPLRNWREVEVRPVTKEFCNTGRSKGSDFRKAIGAVEMVTSDLTIACPVWRILAGGVKDHFGSPVHFFIKPVYWSELVHICRYVNNHGYLLV